MSLTAITTSLAHASYHDLSTTDGVVHLLTAADHLLPAAACIVAGYVAYGLYRRLTSRKLRDVQHHTSSPSGRGQG